MPGFALDAELVETPFQSRQADLVRAKCIVKGNLERFLIHNCGEI